MWVGVGVGAWSCLDLMMTNKEEPVDVEDGVKPCRVQGGLWLQPATGRELGSGEAGSTAPALHPAVTGVSISYLILLLHLIKMTDLLLT